MEKFAVSYVDYSANDDDRPYVLGVYDTNEEAVDALLYDMHTYLVLNEDKSPVAHWNDDFVSTEDGEDLRVWNINTIEV